MIESDAKEAITEQTLPSSKPPFLRRVQIRGYKSIAFCDVTLEPLTLLVGRNGSGKSNFLDALGFLKDVVSGRLSDAVRNRNGWNSISCKSMANPTIRIDIESEFQSIDTTWNATYAIEIGHREDEKIQLLHEQLDLKERANQRHIGYQCIALQRGYSVVFHLRHYANLGIPRQSRLTHGKGVKCVEIPPNAVNPFQTSRFAELVTRPAL